MSRWLAPVAGAVGLLALVVGLVWAELDMTSMSGVGLVGLGAVGLLLGAAVAGVRQGAEVLARHRHG
ncbi:hypothetical protein [Geodermatophilus ruber]|uniref:Uncharacterized protein n=1 Tax=Geodermatophilus ruber TaxID=504800 RepID=A0A1I4GWM9_9ACTN|nr:hypothetical protein [Geodermatophilus ruber]SFL34365.1 hypothetical protein SAMN04488085_109217 [Geodermatophilus ruber]